MESMAIAWIGERKPIRAGRPEPVVGGDMVEGTAARERPLQRGGVPQIPFRNLHVQIFEVAPIAPGPDERAHPLPGRQKPPGDGRADKAGGSRDEDRHGIRPALRAR